jgi:hypothetical protein
MPAVSRYQPLVDYLTSRTVDEVILTYPELEAIIGGELPTAAYGQDTYWSGGQGAAARALRTVGWRGRIDRRNACVRFTRHAGKG